ncbi:ATP-binding protein [Aequorivita marina]|nr:ATP-binding protein [Aequorivita sp. S2608]MDS1298756.1 ATP-binding protein [Aequorivita sp. S2608]
MENLNLTFTANIAESYKRLSYKLWYALAEYIDNSTQAYEENKEELDEQLELDGESLFVDIEYFRGENLSDDYFEIKDNSIGMNEEVLRRAFNTGQKPEINTGRSKYGLGLKTSSFWLGDKWSVTTSRLGNSKEYKITVDIRKIENGNISLEIEENEVDKESHYTNIRIWDLHRRFVGRTLSKVRSYLSSIYRYDLLSEKLEIKWMDKFLTWKNLDNLLVENFEGERTKKEFDFIVDGKPVKGWAGVLNRGDRGQAGFALVQSERVINTNYRPSEIFGEQDGGRNDLVNQRLIGEIFIDGFDVSHTKDQILWSGEQEEELENKLKEEVKELVRIALTRRVRESVDISDVKAIEVALGNLHHEMENEVAIDLIENIEIPPEIALEKANDFLLEAVINRISEPVVIKLGSLLVKLYTDEDMSPFDPYVISDSAAQKKDNYELIVVFNPNHPHWQEIKDDNGVLVFLRHVVYDGVSEWKAWNKTGSIGHDTVKFIKDNLLRIPFEIEKERNEKESRE